MIESDTELVRLLEEGDLSQQLAALREMRNRISSDGEPISFFQIARKHIDRNENDVRWQSLIVIGEYIPFRKMNGQIWDVIISHNHADEDMKDALATVLLEHLLEHDFSTIFPKVFAEVELGNTHLLDLLERCWPFGEAEMHWHRVNALISSHRSMGEV